ncbi:MAG: type II secretion system F family protein [Candidatus Omnitrophica bacterium]|jgi:type IV pilus assembly protein PilC|nr:type II secretion system F family protein [Candidatus Omnitrophota bacterium]MDD5078935.1 type II secretion system F family protein [Candidatus Omnitrophota bacterium]
MPKYIYIARDKIGQKVSGAQDALNEEELISRLQGSDLLVVSVMLASKEGMDSLAISSQSKIGYKTKHHSGINNADQVLFCRQLTTLLGAGITILKSLDTISKQVSSQKLFKAIESLKADMEQGLSFHEALGKHPKIFSELWVNLVESGEASGNLSVVLDRLALYLERDAEFRSKMISSLIYPAILLFASFGALFFLTIKIVPAFAEVFKSFNITMPAPTQILINLSAFMRKGLIYIIGGGVAFFVLFKRYIKTKDGRKNYEQFLFRLPVFGEFFRAINIERFSSEMSTLIESGVPILYSLEITEQSVGSVIIADIIHDIKEDVRAGKPLSQPLEKSGFFEPMVIQMVSIGEEIGELSQMFKRINVFYQDYVETFLTRFVALFEPLILIFMGVVIGLMVIGMFLPIFQLSNMGSGG